MELQNDAQTDQLQQQQQNHQRDGKTEEDNKQETGRRRRTTSTGTTAGVRSDDRAAEIKKIPLESPSSSLSIVSASSPSLPLAAVGRVVEPGPGSERRGVVGPAGQHEEKEEDGEGDKGEEEEQEQEEVNDETAQQQSAVSRLRAAVALEEATLAVRRINLLTQQATLAALHAQRAALQAQRAHLALQRAIERQQLLEGDGGDDGGDGGGGGGGGNNAMRGCTAEEIQKYTEIHVVEYGGGDRGKEGEAAEDDVCSVCLDKLHQGDEVRILPCGHRHHVPCIDTWLLRSGCCPLCKGRLVPTLTPPPQDTTEKRTDPPS